MDRQICVFGVNPAKRPDLMIFNAAVTLLTFTVPDVYLLSVRWELGLVMLITEMDLFQRCIWHSNVIQKRQKCCLIDQC